MNILFIGNSYTYFSDLPALFASLCAANGQDVRVDAVTCGGRKLYENLNEFCSDLNPDDEYAKKIGELVDGVEYDVLFLQEQSCLPILNPEAFFAGVVGLSSVIGAWRTVLYATWGRADGSDTLDHYGWTRESMTKGLYESYCAAAEIAHAEVSPVGLCFAALTDRHPHINLYDPDKSHPSYAGSCVAALCHYKTVFGDMPADLSALNLAPALADTIAAAVDELVTAQ